MAKKTWKQRCLHGIMSWIELYRKFIGETDRRILERVIDHSGRDKNSTVFKHSAITGHKIISMTDVKLVAKGFKSDEPREIAEAFLIREQKPSLNIQNLSKTVKLFTWYLFLCFLHYINFTLFVFSFTTVVLH